MEQVPQDTALSKPGINRLPHSEHKLHSRNMEYKVAMPGRTASVRVNESYKLDVSPLYADGQNCLFRKWLLSP